MRADPDAAEERAVLLRALDLVSALTKAEATAKAARAALDALTAARYVSLTEAEAQTLVVNDKWMAALRTQVEGDVERMGAGLTGRVRLLMDRYDRPLPSLAAEVKVLGERVAVHLSRIRLAA